MPTQHTLHSPHHGVNPETRHCLIYFLTGNPGLIDYYVPFFSHLRTILDNIEVQRNHKVTFTIYGRNLAGFDDDHPVPFNTTDNLPHDVEYVINDCFKHLLAANAIAGPGPRTGEPYDEIILMGHSLGTYIALELFHRHLHSLPPVTDVSSSPEIPQLNLKSGILLFATIAHLAKSPKGVYLNFIRRHPFLARNMPRTAEALLSLLPTAVIRWFTSTILKMPPSAAATTTRFLTSRDGVYQALYLGMDEMAVISEESWAEELWEIGDEAVAHAHEIPKFFIFFGKQDHWVANEYRDKFIESREEHASRDDVPKHKRGRTRIVVDEGDLPHDFCISKFHFSSCIFFVVVVYYSDDLTMMNANISNSSQ